MRYNDKYPKFRSNVLTGSHLKRSSEETQKCIGASVIIKDLEVISPTTSNFTLPSLRIPSMHQLRAPLHWAISMPSFTMATGKALIQCPQCRWTPGSSTALRECSRRNIEVMPYLLGSNYFGIIRRRRINMTARSRIHHELVGNIPSWFIHLGITLTIRFVITTAVLNEYNSAERSRITTGFKDFARRVHY